MPNLMAFLKKINFWENEFVYTVFVGHVINYAVLHVIFKWFAMTTINGTPHVTTCFFEIIFQILAS